MTHIVQLTDLHIREPGQLAYGRINTAPYLERSIQAVRSLRQRPDALVITGDLTDFGRPTEYAHLRALLSELEQPYFLLPGNHDDRTNLRAAFPEHDYLGTTGFVQYGVDIGAVHLVGLDTSEPGQSGGVLCAERLAWLDQHLAGQDPETPVIVAMHHPPFRTLIGHMDDIGLMSGSKELEALISRHKNIQRIICGHLHRAIDTCFGGTLASTSPAPAHQVTLDLHPQAASSWMLEPPAFRIHAWDNEGRRLVTHLASVGDFDGPYPFHEGGKLID